MSKANFVFGHSTAMNSDVNETTEKKLYENSLNLNERNQLTFDHRRCDNVHLCKLPEYPIQFDTDFCFVCDNATVFFPITSSFKCRVFMDKVNSKKNALHSPRNRELCNVESLCSLWLRCDVEEVIQLHTRDARAERQNLKTNRRHAQLPDEVCSWDFIKKNFILLVRSRKL